MNTPPLIVNIAVLVLLPPQQILDSFSNSTIQHIVEVVVPWLHLTSISLNIFKHLAEFFNKKDKTDNKNKTESKNETNNTDNN
jgi:hypothetical protein